MRSIKKPGITALTAAIALSLGAVPVAFTAGLFPGQTTTITPATDYFPGPTLTLNTAPGKATVSLSGSELSQQFDGGQFCQITNIEPSDSLLELAGTIEGTGARPGLAGFRDGSIGVFEGTNASQCFRVDAASFTEFETLTVGLGDDLAEFRAASGLFDLEMKTNDVRIRVEARDASGAPVKFIDIPATTTSPATTTDKLFIYTGKEQRGVTASPTKLTPSVRSGGHFPLALTKALLDGPFTTVTFRAEVGSFTLEGGGDTGASATTLSLVQPEDRELCPSQSYTKGTATVNYLGAFDADRCFGVQLIGTDDYVRFLKPADIAADAEFTFLIDWSVPTPEGDAQVPATVVDFTNSPATTDDVPIGWCHGATYDDEGNLTGLESPPTQDLDGNTLNGVQYACVATQSATTEGDALRVQEQLYVYGDIIMRKP